MRAGAKNKPTVFLVAGDEAFAASLDEQLSAECLPVRLYASAEAFLDEWDRSMAGCLAVDLRLPGMSGLELQARLVEMQIEIPILFLSTQRDAEAVRRAFKAGAVDFLMQPIEAKELLQTVRQAFELDQKRRSAAAGAERIRVRIATLKKRELEVLEYVTRGLTNREIAEKLCLSLVTIKLYRRTAMEKLKVDSLAELVKMWEKR